MNGIVYILKLSNSKYYIGSTSNLPQRLQVHSSGKSKYTSKFLPFEVVFTQEFKDYSKARKAEFWLKKLKNREIVERIISDKKILKEF